MSDGFGGPALARLYRLASVNVAVEITSPASQWRVVSIIYQQFDQMAQRP